MGHFLANSNELRKGKEECLEMWIHSNKMRELHYVE